VAYVVVASLVETAIVRLLRAPAPLLLQERRRRAASISRVRSSARVAGGCSLGARSGNLPELVWKRCPEAGRRHDRSAPPFEISALAARFARSALRKREQLTTRPDVSAVLDNASMEKLLRTPGMIRKVSLAARWRLECARKRWPSMSPKPRCTSRRFSSEFGPSTSWRSSPTSNAGVPRGPAGLQDRDAPLRLPTFASDVDSKRKLNESWMRRPASRIRKCFAFGPLP